MKKLIYQSIGLLLLLTFAGTATYAQVKIGANPGTIGSNSALEVEATNGNKTTVDKATGQVTIQDGTQGAGKILTSDANGKASWVSVAQSTTFLTASGTYTCPFNGNIVGGGLATGVTLTFPQTGWYYIESGLTLLTNGCNDYALYLAGIGDVWRTYCDNTNGGYMVPREQNKMLYVTAGTYPLLAYKTNQFVPTNCNAGNPNFYVRFIRLAL